MNDVPIVEAKNICKTFSFKNGGVKAVDNVSLKIFSGKTCALVGESGSGKSTFANILLGLEKADSGKIFFCKKDTSQFSRAKKKEFRRSAQIIFQNPFEALDPLMKIKDIIAEPLLIHKIGGCKKTRAKIVNEMRTLTGLDAALMERFPKELSGGQRQKVAICAAMILRPKFLVCDECTSALDVLAESQILHLLKNFQKSLGLSYLFISHNLKSAFFMADTIAVMKDGRIVEEGPAKKVLENPQNEYTKKLILAAM